MFTYTSDTKIVRFNTPPPPNLLIIGESFQPRKLFDFFAISQKEWPRLYCALFCKYV